MTNDALLGTWLQFDDRNVKTFTFSANASGGYDLRTAGEGGVAAYSVYLVQLGDQLFADVFPNLSQVGMPHLDYGPWDYAPFHNVYRIEQFEPTLKFTHLDDAWLDQLLQADPAAVSTALADHNLGDDQTDLRVLTCSTAELQEFYLAQSTAAEAFEACGELKRLE